MERGLEKGFENGKRTWKRNRTWKERTWKRNRTWKRSYIVVLYGLKTFQRKVPCDHIRT